MIDLTIFTPTYNRAHCLDQLYKSLLEQDDDRFEWLIVDDGSSDETRELVDYWIKQANFPIRYLYQDNSGKMAAHNRGVQEAQGKYFVCIDSDDYLVPGAVKIILSEFSALQTENAEFAICGIVAYKGDKENNPIKNQLFPNHSYGTLLEFGEKGFSADTTLIFFTDVIRKYPFPKFGTEKFVTEAIVYDKLGVQYKFKTLQKILTICEYREDGYTNNSNELHLKNPLGWMAYYYQRIGKIKSIKKKIANAALYDAHALIAKKKLKIVLNRYFYLTVPSIVFGIRFYRLYKNN